jgi:putative chitinase
MTDWTKIVRAVADPRGKKPDPAIVAMIADHADEVFPRYGITTIRRQACILAHACVETANFSTLEESLNYSAERLHVVWPKRFPTVASAQPFAHNPQALANKVYGGRLGNRAGTDDGWVFRGKGLLQSTGRENGLMLGRKLGVSADVAAAWLIHPDHALECACALFVALGVLPAADSGDVVAQTRRINGGKNGLAERQAAYARAVRALSREAARARLEDDGESADAGAPVTDRDLRAAGSRTIAGADEVKTGLALLTTGGAAATEVASQVSDIALQVREGADSVRSAAGALAWAQDHWKLLALAALLALVAWGAWRIWRGASLVTRARVDDARLGVNIGR